MPSNNVSLIDLYLISPGICLFLSAILILLVKTMLKNKEPGKNITTALATGGIATTWFLSLSIFNSLHGDKLYAFKESLVFDSFTYWSGVAILVGAFFSLVLFRKNGDIAKEQFSEFVFLFLNSVLGVLVVLWSNSLLVLFVGIELVALPLYTMILLSRKSGYTKESAVKYYILGSVASAFFLLGMVLVFGASAGQFGDEVLLDIGSLLEASSELMKVDHLFLIGSLFMLLAALLKLGVVPFHNWVPDVYQGANTAVTYYMITVAKISAVFVILKLMSAGFMVESEFFQQAIQWIVVASMLCGALFALSQESVKRIFAYSGVAQSGYMLMSILGYGFDGEGSVDALVFYFFPYVFFSGIIFYILQKLENRKGADITVSDLTGLARRWPKEAMVLLVGIIGVSGVPPLVGFAAKAYIMKATIEMGFYWVAFWGLLASAVSIVYYLNLISRMYFYDYQADLHVLWTGALEKKTLTLKGFLSVLALFSISLVFLYYFPVNS